MIPQKNCLPEPKEKDQKEWVQLKNIRIHGCTENAYRLAWQTYGGINTCWVPKWAIRDPYQKSKQCLLRMANEKSLPMLYKDSIYGQSRGVPELIDELSSWVQLSVSTDGNMPQQTAALQHLHCRKVFALFMECRAGKTKTAIDLVTCHFKAGRIDRCLWIMPLSVQRTAEWQWSVFRQADFPVMLFGAETISGCGQKRLEPMLRFVREGKCALIVDESHMFKNGLSRRFKRLMDIAHLFHLRGLLSGSPITQNLHDIYAQARLLDWRILGYHKYWHFQREHLVMSEKYPGLVRDTKNEEHITTSLDPYVFSYFPPPSTRDEEKIVCVDMSDEQVEAYRHIKRVILKRMENQEENQCDIYLLFTALQSVMSGHLSARIQAQVDGEDEKTLSHQEFDTPKLCALVRTRAGIDGKVVIWCARKHEVSKICEAIPDVVTVSGDDKPDERHEKIAAFRKSQCGTLVAMLPVAKRGIDIYECDVSMFYGQSFDYESRIQAAARIKAPAIKNTPCTYYDFIYRDSLDERILKSHEKKESIIGYFTRLMKQNRERAFRELSAV